MWFSHHNPPGKCGSFDSRKSFTTTPQVSSEERRSDQDPAWLLKPTTTPQVSSEERRSDQDPAWLLKNPAFPSRKKENGEKDVLRLDDMVAEFLPSKDNLRGKLATNLRKDRWAISHGGCTYERPRDELTGAPREGLPIFAGYVYLRAPPSRRNRKANLVVRRSVGPRNHLQQTARTKNGFSQKDRFPLLGPFEL